jgi:aspartate kinase
MIVMKFGGTSVGSAERMQRAMALVAKYRDEQPVVVTSAMTQVTNQLEDLAQLAARGNRTRLIATKLAALQAVHNTAVTELQLDAAAETALRDVVHAKIAILGNILKSVSALGELTPRGRDLILSFGERLSIHLVAAALNSQGVPAVAVNATKFVVTDDTFTDAQPLLSRSKTKAKKLLMPLIKDGVVPVITGFIGATTEGVTTTLGRGGSDFSSTIVGYCLGADEVWIWTDVDGVMTSDPRIIPEARSIEHMSYEEAAELSYFGAKVIHPRTMVPTEELGIPIVIKNTMNPTHVGTRITPGGDTAARGAKALTILRDQTMLTIQGKGMRGVYGTAARAFAVLAATKTNILFISQASSENNITLVVEKAAATRAVRALRQTFAAEVRAKRIDFVQQQSGVSLIAVVGMGLRQQHGMAGQIFSALGQCGVNIIAIAQGSSELNITMVVSDQDGTKALQCIHQALYTKSNGGQP